MISTRPSLLLAATTILSLSRPVLASNCPAITPPPTYESWPRIESAVKKDVVQESFIKAFVATMTLEEKIGQMTQPDISSVTPDDVEEFFLGSVLNGGDSRPRTNKRASAAQWLELADAFWKASQSTRLKIPILWGADAVHGHSGILGATVLPHDIGLGATRDTCLMKRIGQFTAQQMRVTGQDWNFGPCVAVVRDDRWGRTYEGFSEDPAITRVYAEEMLKGLQDLDPKGPWLRGILGTLKHFIGDGGTENGSDQGLNQAPERDLMNIHGQGYFGGLGAGGAQSVMVSFSSWGEQGAVHGSRYLITEVLKEKMGFDGMVVSDWNGIGRIEGCTNWQCPPAVNAGIDMFMVPYDWKGFYKELIREVKSGVVPMARIDDAVTRILRVKLRAGLFGMPKPSARQGAGVASRLVDRDLAREAVRESLVLLKNNRATLPLSRGQKILVVGKSADNIANQAGGWTITWQGTDLSNDYFPAGSTILAGIREAVGEENVTFDPEGKAANVREHKVVIAAIGETPYAEMKGDIETPRTLEHARNYPEDLEVIDRVANKGVPVVTVFLSGRPLYVNKELNRSDAFVAAWLPGTEGAGIADLLFRNAKGESGADFTGRLSYSWPRSACQTPLNVGDKNYQPLFPFGYGLTYKDKKQIPKLDESPGSPNGCGQM